MLLDVKPVVYLCDAIVDVVDSEMYLGNRLYNNIYKQKMMNLSVILKDEAIILLKNFQCAIVLLYSIYFPHSVKVFMDVNY